MSNDLAKLIVSLRSSARLNSKTSDTTNKKMLALAIDPLLVSVPLTEAIQISRGSQRALIEHMLQKMTLTQLKKLTKSWDPQKKFPKECTMTEVRTHLNALLNGAPLTPKPEKSSKTKAKK